MKYRVKYLNGPLPWKIQFKNHWWNIWKICNSYDTIEDAYRNLINYETNGKCILKKKIKFPHNRIKGKNVNCFLKLGKINTVNENYNEGNHYCAGYKPINYGKYYYCSYGKSYEEAIYKLWGDLEVKKLLHHLD